MTSVEADTVELIVPATENVEEITTDQAHNKKRVLGKMIRKTLVELVDDFCLLGGNKQFCDDFKEEIRACNASSVVDHLNSEEFEKNHFLFGKLPLIFLIESQAGPNYIRILTLANPQIQTWFESLLSKPVPTPISGDAANVGVESMLNMIDPSINLGANSPLVALTNDLTKELLSEGQNAGSLNFSQMMRKIQGKIENKLQTGELDVNQLQSQAEQVMEKMNNNPQLSQLIGNTDLLSSFAGMMGESPKLNKKKK